MRPPAGPARRPHLILHTTDGGKSWQNVTPPYPVGSMGPEWLVAFASLTGTQAWVAVSEKRMNRTWSFAPAMVDIAGSRPHCPRAD